ncbi:MAG: (2Fe-2S) ferredoxin domain-containing protein [Candidatus Methanoplasma sp.]|nr:(2Fe-2S) ferredoxin domain-containing protein [Candidatus Methanoplasma sp.]
MICTSCRANGVQKGFCFSQNSPELVQRFMEEVDDRGLSSEVMITNTGCFGICSEGPIVAVYPEGVWYGKVKSDDVAKIVEEHFEGGQPVKSLMI